MIKLGGIDKTFEEHRDQRGFRWLEELQRNVRYAGRILWKQKALSLTVIGLLALASGGNIATFSYYNSFFLRPLPFPDGDRLVDLDETAPKWNQPSALIDYTDFHEWRKENRSFDAMAVYGSRDNHYSRKGKASYIRTHNVTHDLTSVLRIQPVLGRSFLEDEDLPGGSKVAILGYGFWQREFGGSRSALGETIRLDGEAYSVIGVLPINASFPSRFDVWTPLQMSPSDLSRAYFLRGIGRLKEGVTLAMAQEDITRIHKNMIDRRPVNKITSPRLQSLREREFGSLTSIILLIQTSVGILLLIACANIAGMMLARSESRSREMGIRAALGSSPAGIVRQLLTESLLLAIPGVLLGLLLGNLILKLTFVWLGDPFPWVEFTMDIRILAFCGLLMGASTIFFGLAPALQAARVNAHHTLHEMGTQQSSSRSRRRGLNALVVGEIALAFVLLVGAGLLVRTWQKTVAVDPGFQVKNILTFMIQLTQSDYKEQSDRARFYEQFLKRCRQLPGVLAVSGAIPPPVSRGLMPQYFEIEGAQLPPGEPDPLIPTRSILPGYFKTMGISLLSGRVFTEEDGNTKRAVIVNQSFARRFWPNADPIGKRIRYRDEAGAGQWMTVVGLSPDNKEYGLDQPTPAAVYYPYYQTPNYAIYFLIRSSMDPAGLLGPIRSLLSEMDPEVPLLYQSTLAEAVDKSLEHRSIPSIMLVIIAVVSLLVAATGIYGVVSYGVSRRTHEIGIRMALGATRGHVLNIMVGGSMRLLVVGAVFGAASAFGASQAMRGMLFGITTFDVLTYFIAGGVIIGAVLAASLLPARRAASIDPMRTLRSE